MSTPALSAQTRLVSRLPPRALSTAAQSTCCGATPQPPAKLPPAMSPLKPAPAALLVHRTETLQQALRTRQRRSPPRPIIVITSPVCKTALMFGHCTCAPRSHSLFHPDKPATGEWHLFCRATGTPTPRVCATYAWGGDSEAANGCRGGCGLKHRGYAGPTLITKFLQRHSIAVPASPGPGGGPGPAAGGAGGGGSSGSGGSGPRRQAVWSPLGRMGPPSS